VSKKNIQILVIIGCSLILCGLLLNNFLKGDSSSRVEFDKMIDSVSNIFNDFDGYVRLLADKEINDSLERIMQEKVQEGWKRNPFEILVSTVILKDDEKESSIFTSVGDPTFTVSGIVYEMKPEDSSVIINGEFYKLGDNVNGWTVVDIKAENVHFKKGETEYIYNLYEHEK